MWAEGVLPRVVCERIVMRLDDYNMGQITPNNLSRVLRNESLKSFVDRCIKGEFVKLNSN